MSSREDAGLVYACVTHVQPWLAFPDFVTTIHLGQAQGEGRLNLRELAPEWEPHHPVLGGTAGSFALKNYLRRHRPDATRVGICQYRKFVSRQRVSGVRDPKYRVMDVVPKTALEGARFAQVLWPGEAPFVLSAPLRFTRLPWYRRGYLKEYTRDHHVEDLLRFTAEAVDQGVLAPREVQAFFREDVIVPGGVELGVFPADFWLESIEGIERVVRACVTKHPLVRENYQARAWSFCAERLGSWLLLRRLRSEAGTGFFTRHVEWVNRRRWTRRYAGQLNLIVEGDAHTGYKGGV
ncbi:MAG TPA: hypothetical protein VJ743_11885 [Albitalea sp.]|nr:hypothetical protein [Albitalea sp.]